MEEIELTIPPGATHYCTACLRWYVTDFCTRACRILLIAVECDNCRLGSDTAKYIQEDVDNSLPEGYW